MTTKVQSTTTLTTISLRFIEPHPDNARFLTRNGTAIQELAESIRERGLLQPIIVRPLDNGPAYQICAGHRRFEAAKSLGWHEIACIVTDIDDAEALRVLVTENMHRRDLHPLEESSIINTMIARGWEIADIAAELGRTRQFIARRAYLSSLTEAWQDAYINGNDTHAWPVSLMEQIATLSPEDQQRLYDEVIEEGGNAADDEPSHSDRFRFTMTPKSVAEYLKTQFTQRLSHAPFPLTVVMPGIDAPACINCPNRSGRREPLLFDSPDQHHDPDGFGPNEICLRGHCFTKKTVAEVIQRSQIIADKHPAAVPAGKPAIIALNARIATPHGGDYNDAGAPYVNLWGYDNINTKRTPNTPIAAVIGNGPQTGRTAFIHHYEYERELEKQAAKATKSSAAGGEAGGEAAAGVQETEQPKRQKHESGLTQKQRLAVAREIANAISHRPRHVPIDAEITSEQISGAIACCIAFGIMPDTLPTADAWDQLALMRKMSFADMLNQAMMRVACVVAQRLGRSRPDEVFDDARRFAKLWGIDFEGVIESIRENDGDKNESDSAE